MDFGNKHVYSVLMGKKSCILMQSISAVIGHTKRRKNMKLL